MDEYRRNVFTENWLRFYDDWLKHLGHLRDVQARGIEIGCYEGRSSVWLVENILTHPYSVLVCVDKFEPFDGNAGDYEQRFLENIEPFRDKITIAHGDSKYILPMMSHDKWDFAIVDGSHVARDVMRDAINAWDLLKPGGIIIFDDYEWTLGGNPLDCPAMGIDLFITLYQPRILHKGYQVIVSKP